MTEYDPSIHCCQRNVELLDALGQLQARADANADHAKLANQNQAFQAKALKAANERIEQLEAALCKIRSVVGTSTEAWHIADDAIQFAGDRTP